MRSGLCEVCASADVIVAEVRQQAAEAGLAGDPACPLSKIAVADVDHAERFLAGRPGRMVIEGVARACATSLLTQDSEQAIWQRRLPKNCHAKMLGNSKPKPRFQQCEEPEPVVLICVHGHKLLAGYLGITSFMETTRFGDCFMVPRLSLTLPVSPASWDWPAVTALLGATARTLARIH
jgi:hypothetical protein